MQDVADFLAPHPPFDSLDPTDVLRVAEAAEVEFHPAGVEIFQQGAAPVEYVWMVRNGAVEIVHDGRVLDLLGAGELFGHASMLSGLPTGFAAIAAEDLLCYRIPAKVATPLLARPAGLRYVTRSLLEFTDRQPAEPAVNPTQRPVADLIRKPLVLCTPDTTIREAARVMSDLGATSAVVDAGDSLGIVTDRDLRSRVVAAGVDPDAPVSAVMSAPAYTVTADRRGSEVLLDMLDRGIRHFPVLSADGRVVGVVEDSDLVAVATRSSFHLRAAIARADSVEEVAEAATGLRPAIVALHDAHVSASDISAIQSVVADALVRRLLDLIVAEVGAPPVPFAWIALGSIARREAVPSSDVDSALVWQTDDDAPELRAELMGIARRVMDGLAAAGLPPDPKGAVASKSLFARSLTEWHAAAASWIDNPTQEKALILVSLVVDGRPVWGIRTGPPVPDAFRDARRNPALLRLLAHFALSHRPPTGFLRGLVVEHSGEHRGRLDLKRGGILPIADLARWAGLAAGVTHASTQARLHAAAEAGTMQPEDAQLLAEAHELIVGLRLGHQVEQLKAGVEPDDFLDPGDLSPLTRSSLKEAFRTIAGVQRRIGSDLRLGAR